MHLSEVGGNNLADDLFEDLGVSDEKNRRRLQTGKCYYLV